MSTNTASRGDLCPSCERFVGPADHCPYCGEESAKSPFIRRLRYAAVALSVLGLGSLFLMATRRELPVLQVNGITSTMNFAYVRLVGTVARDPYVVRRNGDVDYMSFMLDDGTGRIRVQAHRETARALHRMKIVPARGDVVDVAGSLSVAAEGSRKLRIQSPQQIKILPAVTTNQNHQRSPGGQVADVKNIPPKS
jgi:DNA/RNA endonuclease YhcR with UshA esterase domain